MNWSFKKVGLFILILCMASGLAADNSVFIGDGDVGSLKLYDRNGRPIDATLEDASDIGEGWIISNPDSDLLIVTPVGTVNIYQGSLAVTTSLATRDIEISLIRGKATFKATNLFGGSLTVSTPASRYTLRQTGEVFIVTSDSEESVTVFSGSVNSYNIITQKSTTIRPFEKLYMQNMSRMSEAVQSGYYLTYATYPEIAIARQTREQRAAAGLLIAGSPTFKGVQVTRLAPVIEEPVVVIPEPIVEEPIAAETVMVPTVIDTITATAETQAPPADLFEIIVEVEEEEELPPATPAIPTIATVTREAIVEEVVEPVAVTPIPLAPSFAGVQTTNLEQEEEEMLPVAPSIPSVPSVAAVSSAPSVTAEPAAPVAAPPTQPETESNTRPSLSSSAAQAKRSGLFGVEMGYEFLLDGTNANAMTHRLYAKPYVDKGPFAIRLNGSIETSDFTAFDNTFAPVPSGAFGLVNYIFTYIDHLRIGYETSPFYLVADHSRSLRSELSTFFAPPFGEDNRLVLQNKITIGAFSLFTSIDDMRVKSLMDGNSQFASMLFQFTAPKGYPITVALGTLVEAKNSMNTVDLYPLLSFKLPIINSRTTQFSALIQAQGYLPVYPTIDFDQFVDTSLASFFPNYLLGAGFSLTQGGFSAKLLASLNDGMNHNFLVNDFTYSNIDTSYDSIVDVLTELGWKGKNVKANLAINLPLTSSFTFATLTGGQTADFTQLSLDVTVKGLTIGLGLQQLGIITTIGDLANGSGSLLDLLSGPYAASYLKVGYTWAPFTFTAKATYPANSTSFTVPIISVAAKVDLNMRF